MPQPLNMLGAEQRRRDARGALGGADAAPQGVTGVGGDRVHRSAIAVEGQRVGARRLQPEPVLEPLAERLGGRLLALGERRRPRAGARQTRAASAAANT